MKFIEIRTVYDELYTINPMQIVTFKTNNKRLHIYMSDSTQFVVKKPTYEEFERMLRNA